MTRDFLLKNIPNETQMLAMGEKWAEVSAAPLTIFLYGNLGAGKTTLVRGFLRGLGYQGIVKSPTYTLVEPYTFDQFHVYHFDFYRVKNVEELEFMGLQDYFNEKAVCLIEWPENASALLPIVDMSCYIENYALGRTVKWVAHTEKGKTILKRLGTGGGGVK